MHKISIINQNIQDPSTEICLQHTNYVTWHVDGSYVVVGLGHIRWSYRKLWAHLSYTETNDVSKI